MALFSISKRQVKNKCDNMGREETMTKVIFHFGQIYFGFLHFGLCISNFEFRNLEFRILHFGFCKSDFSISDFFYYIKIYLFYKFRNIIHYKNYY